jgi:molecular chaperone DnaK (HSP70)
VGSRGDAVDFFPTVTAELDGRLVHGFEAERGAARGAPVLRSWKRMLAQCGPDAEVTIGACRVGILELVTDFLRALRAALDAAATLPGRLKPDTPVVASVPANAPSTQRFVTLEAYRRAGFAVCALLNEPSAAGIEYASRYPRSITARRAHIVVYDLGGGTFDAALVRMAADHHDVLHTSGVARLGGDDFDAALLEIAAERLGLRLDALPETVVADALLECRTVKEAIHPNSRRLVLELAALHELAPTGPLVIPVAEFYDRVRPLVEQSFAVLAPVVDRALAEAAEDGAAPVDASAPGATEGQGDESDVGTPEEMLAGIYVVGGGSGLPLVSRMLRERFGRRVHRSAQASAATAIGLALVADRGRAPRLTERLTRHFGLFRELDGGRRISFDPIFVKGTEMPAGRGGRLDAVRHYQAMHDVGIFRFVECGEIGASGEPSGDVQPHATVLFPFVAEARERLGEVASPSARPTTRTRAARLRPDDAVDDVPVARLADPGPHVEERYELDASGVFRVTIRVLDDGYERSYTL